jgi:hypothetical protein
MFHPNGKPTLDNTRATHRNGGGGRNSTPHAETKARPPTERDLGVGIIIDGMGMWNARYTGEGKEDMVDIPQMETLYEMNRWCRSNGTQGWKGGHHWDAPNTLMDGIDGSTTLDETLGPDMV